MLNLENGYPAPNRHGLGWNFDSCGSEPFWTVNPDVEVIQRTAEKYLGQPIELEFLGGGLYNKAYAVSVDGVSKFVFRVALPVHPHYKTASEVATLEFIGNHTRIPVPRVYYYDSTSENDLHFEWILMDLVKGVRLAEVWNDMGIERMSDSVTEVATLLNQLRELRFSHIGSLYRRDDLPGEEGMKDAVFIPLDEKFRMYERAHYEILPEIFPKDPPDSEMENGTQFRLYHPDLHENNIFIDPETFTVTGIIDWESVATIPGWMDHYPKYLDGIDVDDEQPTLTVGELSDEWLDWALMQLRRVHDEASGRSNANSPGDVLKFKFKDYFDMIFRKGEYATCLFEEILQRKRASGCPHTQGPPT
ncbi:kinase-like protein [Ascobolus immersus RN42]|uniref:Kinase-like protein n=1 Tax=Ascobolus immersus RN42 TaxID=1160509 RepID=A0A3N4HM73_ASCIM|nr:kinase-like protein [Ascobolus immersus RN42]